MMVDIEATSQNITDIHRQLGPKEQRRHARQVDIEHQKLLAIGRHRLELQAFPIGNPGPPPKQQYRRKKYHGRADAKPSTGAEIDKTEQLARQAALAASTSRKDAGALLHRPASPDIRP